MNEASYDIELGTLIMKYKDDILYNLSITDKRKLENNEKNKFTDKVYKEIQEYMKGQRKTFDIKYKFEGTEFQKKVWKVLETIPYGKVLTYLEVAKIINNRKAVRAVGGACHRNPIWLIVPCHRVVGSNGKLTGYAGGLDMKQKLLEIENKNKDVPPMLKKRKI
ncbi:methylated-dna--protein-cysteine methyltransferase [Anaeromyces robustus]|uniref:Methylated-DNA--protein-cysteine methyltransferase n=1 Tax=Anaeromyces robustus TaxID=1754192 RepID=A0A1Y1WYU8_9FUNG|nr:methylated-dna--protein-cysteine methyltransferase [Anaeromyces robustus]|eukprot:ORX78673.1 methylated-dna--protein-cysteine methyltransferase [Anaeromyces robustus]